ncbi:MAG: hypothetical protein RLZZ230_709 [Candidatus Parcubacteria bacterium]|jgi:trk system potassium uptake protein TrkH
MWAVYSTLTLAAFLFLLLGGMSIVDALAHAFSTLSTGGFSTRNVSVAAFSPYIQYVIIIFMILAATNFALLYSGLTGRFRDFWKNDEFKTYLLVIISATAFIVSYLIEEGSSAEEAFRIGLFQVVSIITTTGFATTDYTLWALPPVFAIGTLMFIGGMSGSTTGGIKIVRYVILIKSVFLEFRRQLFPDAILPLRFNSIRVPESMVFRVIAFVLLYFIIFIIGLFVLLLQGIDFATAVGAVAATLGNIGPGFGAVGPAGNFAFFSNEIKYFLSGLMIVGRLEIFTVLILLTTYFWKRY